MPEDPPIQPEGRPERERGVPAAELRVDLREALSEGNGQAGDAAGGERSPVPPPPAPEEPTGPEEPPLSTELEPGDIYRIEDGREVRDSLWSRFGGGVREALTSPTAKEEERLDHDLQQLRWRGLAQGVTLALGSIKGGVGKTTLTLALADTLADALRCGVIVIDADLEWGTAADSTPEGGRLGGTLVDVLRAKDQIDSPGALAPYLKALPGGAQLLAGPTEPSDIESLEASDMQDLLDLVKRFFPIVLIDLSPGIGLRGTIPRWAFSVADEIVAIATPTRGSVRRAGRMFAYLTDQRPNVPITLVLNMVPRRPDPAIRRVIEVAQRTSGPDSGLSRRRYAAIPRDDALMRQLDAGLLNIGDLGQLTRVSVKDFAYKLASRWCR
ncbi:MAG TPA: AAA family ATPase [Solirubrobacteraceae bacterium]|nr:AAA family ATPase [Solirubrobacteraceae bacterium]